MDKEMRTWDTYITLEATVKNMLTSLRAVGELQNAAIRERHWQQLMTSTKVMIQHNLMLCFYYAGCHRITLSFAMFGTVGCVWELMVHILNMYLQ
jgi:Dynein heavy chain, N-terminal region 2.